MKKQFKFFISIFLVLVVIIFSILNTETIKINFLFKQVHMPLIILIISTFIIGAISSALFTIGSSSDSKEQNEKVFDDKYLKNVKISEDTDIADALNKNTSKNDK